MLSGLKARAIAAAVALIAFFGLILGALRIGRRQGRAEAAAARDLAEARGYQKTMEDAINAPHHTDAAAARASMHARDPRKP